MAVTSHRGKRREIDTELVEKLAAVGLTTREISDITGVPTRTLEHKCADAMRIGRSKMAASIKRKQYEVAMSGSVPMLIWLGKIYLGQRDPDRSKALSAEKASDVDKMSDEDLAAAIEAGRQVEKILRSMVDGKKETRH